MQNVKLEFSESMKTVRVLNSENNNLIAEILVHGFLKRAVDMSDSHGKYVFRGEVFQLASWEYLDMKAEVITEHREVF